jgi:hypothetical protein
VEARTGHNYEQFKVFHDQTEKENDIVNHSQVRWLSISKVLKQLSAFEKDKKISSSLMYLEVQNR